MIQASIFLKSGPSANPLSHSILHLLNKILLPVGGCFSVIHRAEVLHPVQLRLLTFILDAPLESHKPQGDDL